MPHSASFLVLSTHLLGCPPAPEPILCVSPCAHSFHELLISLVSESSLPSCCPVLSSPLQPHTGHRGLKAALTLSFWVSFPACWPESTRWLAVRCAPPLPQSCSSQLVVNWAPKHPVSSGQNQRGLGVSPGSATNLLCGISQGSKPLWAAVSLSVQGDTNTSSKGVLRMQHHM